MTAPLEPGPQAPDTARHRTWVRGVVGLVIGVALVVFGVPAVGDLDAVLGDIGRFAGWQIAVLAVLAVPPILAATSMWTAAVPSLRLGSVALLYLSCTAVGYVLPAGAAIATAMSVGMLAVLGVPAERVPAVVLVTGLWNILVRMGLPVIAFTLAEAVGDASAPLRASALVGGVAVVVILGGISLLFLLGGAGGGFLGRFAGPVGRLAARFGRKEFDLVEAGGLFRTATEEIVGRRWPWLTAAALLFPLAQFALLWVVLSFLGAGPEPVPVFGAFAVVSQVTSVPITPGALGVAEVSLIGALRSAGIGVSVATTATLVYRFFTYVVLIPLGGLAYLGWNRRAFGLRG